MKTTIQSSNYQSSAVFWINNRLSSLVDNGCQNDQQTHLSSDEHPTTKSVKTSLRPIISSARLRHDVLRNLLKLCSVNTCIYVFFSWVASPSDYSLFSNKTLFKFHFIIVKHTNIILINRLRCQYQTSDNRYHIFKNQ